MKSKLSAHQFALMRLCAVNGMQPSTATEQNTIRSLIARGWMERLKLGGRVSISLTPDGFTEFSVECSRRLIAEPIGARRMRESLFAKAAS